MERVGERDGKRQRDRKRKTCSRVDSSERPALPLNPYRNVINKRSIGDAVYKFYSTSLLEVSSLLRSIFYIARHCKLDKRPFSVMVI